MKAIKCNLLEKDDILFWFSSRGLYLLMLWVGVRLELHRSIWSWGSLNCLAASSSHLYLLCNTDFKRFDLIAVPNFGVPSSAGGPRDSRLHLVIGKVQITGVFPLPPSDWPCHVAPVVTEEAWGSGTTQPCHLSPDQRGPCPRLTGVKALDEASAALESGAWSTLRVARRWFTRSEETLKICEVVKWDS